MCQLQVVSIRGPSRWADSCKKAKDQIEKKSIFHNVINAHTLYFRSTPFHASNQDPGFSRSTLVCGLCFQMSASTQLKIALRIQISLKHSISETISLIICSHHLVVAMSLQSSDSTDQGNSCSAHSSHTITIVDVRASR